MTHDWNDFVQRNPTFATAMVMAVALLMLLAVGAINKAAVRQATNAAVANQAAPAR